MDQPFHLAFLVTKQQSVVLLHITCICVVLLGCCDTSITHPISLYQSLFITNQFNCLLLSHSLQIILE